MNGNHNAAGPAAAGGWDAPAQTGSAPAAWETAQSNGSAGAGLSTGGGW